MFKIIFLCSALLLFSSSAIAADGMIYHFKGPVLINGKLASANTPIHFGDEVLTGDKAYITLKLDGSVYRMGSRSRLALPETKENFTLNLFFGSVLAVFRRDTTKTIRTRTAVLGVRGTGLFLNEDNEQTYLCTCYGDIVFSDKRDATNTAHIHAEYHQVIAFNHHTKTFTKPAMVGHVTQDLFDLEALAERIPPTTFAVDFHANNKVAQ